MAIKNKLTFIETSCANAYILNQQRKLCFFFFTLKNIDFLLWSHELRAQFIKVFLKVEFSHLAQPNFVNPLMKFG